jgi:hypothetical protein
VMPRVVSCELLAIPSKMRRDYTRSKRFTALRLCESAETERNPRKFSTAMVLPDMCNEFPITSITALQCKRVIGLGEVSFESGE